MRNNLTPYIKRDGKFDDQKDRIKAGVINVILLIIAFLAMVVILTGWGTDLLVPSSGETETVEYVTDSMDTGYGMSE